LTFKQIGNDGLEKMKNKYREENQIHLLVINISKS